MTEYIILVALIAVAAIAAVKFFGGGTDTEKMAVVETK